MKIKRLLALATLSLLLSVSPVAAQTGGVIVLGAGTPVEVPSEVSWTVWAEVADDLFNPVTTRLLEVQGKLKSTRDETCGLGMEGGFMPDSDLSELELGDNHPTAAETAQYFGAALGRPIGYLRGIEESGVADLNYLTILIWATLAGISWISLIATIVYGIRIARWLLEAVLRIWELLPLKAS